MSIYKVQLYVECTEDDARSLRKSLAQSVSEGFELACVFGVCVELEPDSDNERGFNNGSFF